MPVAGTVSSAVPFLFTPQDGPFNQALNTDLQSLAQINNLQPPNVIGPTVASYTLLSTDFNRMVLSNGAASTLTVIIPSSLASGFIFYTCALTNKLTVAPNSGSIIMAGGAVSTMTFSTNGQSGMFMWDGFNAYAMASNSTVP